MSKDEKAVNVETFAVNGVPDNADDELLAALGYKAEFKREFSVRMSSSGRWARGSDVVVFQMLETIAFAVSIMGVIASVTSTFSFPLVSGVCVSRVW